MDKFIGRQEEKNLINSILDRDNGAILIYGKRKIGKTTLIKEVLQSRQENQTAAALPPVLFWTCCS